MHDRLRRIVAAIPLVDFVAAHPLGGLDGEGDVLEVGLDAELGLGLLIAGGDVGEDGDVDAAGELVIVPPRADLLGEHGADVGAELEIAQGGFDFAALAVQRAGDGGADGAGVGCGCPRRGRRG